MTLRFSILASLCIHSLAAQVSEHDLKRLYPMTPDGTFIISGDVSLKAVFDKRGQACVLTLLGAIAEDQVLGLFDVLVPAKSRGVKKQDIIECVGTCERNMVYENVTLATGAVGRQTSDPACRCRSKQNGAEHQEIALPSRLSLVNTLH